MFEREGGDAAREEGGMLRCQAPHMETAQTVGIRPPPSLLIVTTRIHHEPRAFVTIIDDIVLSLSSSCDLTHRPVDLAARTQIEDTATTQWFFPAGVTSTLAC